MRMEWTAGPGRGTASCQKWGPEEGGAGLKRKGAAPGGWMWGSREAQVQPALHRWPHSAPSGFVISGAASRSPGQEASGGGGGSVCAART